MKHTVTKKPYFLLTEPETIDDDLLNQLLGLAVEDPHKPLSGVHSPRYPLKPRDGIDYLYPRNYVLCKDFRRVEKKAKHGKVTAKLQRLIQASLEKGGSQHVTLEAAGFRRITMHNARTMIEDLLKDSNDTNTVVVPQTSPTPSPSSSQAPPLSDNQGADKNEPDASEDENTTQAANAPPPPPPPSGGFLGSVVKILTSPFTGPEPTPVQDPVVEDPEAKEAKRLAKQRECKAEYRKQVLELLRKQKDRKLCIITSVITCSELSKNMEKTKITAVGAGAGTEVAGADPHIVNIQVDGTYSNTHDVGTQGAYIGEHLIACSYLPLHLRSKPNALKVPLIKYHLVPVDTGHDIVIGPEEIWSVGDGEIEGDMKASLAGYSSSSIDEPDEPAVTKEEAEMFSFSLLYGDDDTADSEEDSDADEESDDQDARNETADDSESNDENE